jgi:hypothetical protein
MSITLKNVGSGFKRSSLNENFDTIETELNDKVLYRDSPSGRSNAMLQDLDMNSKAILNGGDSSFTQLTVGGLLLDVDGTGVSTLPDQAGQAGKYLTTDSVNASWAAVTGGAGGYEATVSDMLASTSTDTGVIISTGGYYVEGDGGGADYKRTLASAFAGTPDELSDITSGLFVYTLIDKEGKWKSGAKWGVTTTNLDDVIVALKAKYSDDAAIVLPAGNFDSTDTLDIDLIGAEAKGQGATDGTPTIIFKQEATSPIFTLKKSKQVLLNVLGTFSDVIDSTTSTIATSTGAYGVYVLTGVQPTFCDVNVEINNAHAAIYFAGSAFGSTIKVNAKYCYAMGKGDESINQTSMNLTIQGLGCFNGINIPKIVYSNVSAYFDQCGLTPANSTYVPAGITPVLVEADTWRGVTMPYLGQEDSVAPIIRLSAYSTVGIDAMHTVITSSTTMWKRSFDGDRELIETPNGTANYALVLDEQAYFMVNTGSLRVSNWYANHTGGSFESAAIADTPLVHGRDGAPASDASIHFDNCHVQLDSYIVRDRSTTLGGVTYLDYDVLTDTIYADEKYMSQSPNSRILLNHIDGDGGHLLKRVVPIDHTDSQVTFSSDRYSYSFYKEISGTTLHNALQVRVTGQSASSVMSVIDIEVMDSQLNNSANFYNSAKFFVNSLTSVSPTFVTGSHTISSFNSTLSSGGGTDTYVKKTTGTFSDNILVKVTVTGQQVRWHQNPTSITDSGRGNLILTQANVTSFTL